MPTKKKLALQQNNNLDVLPTLYIDGANIHSRKDGMHYIRLTVGLPDVVQEQARIMISDVHLRRIIDVFSKVTDYYPVKSNEDKKT